MARVSACSFLGLDFLGGVLVGERKWCWEWGGAVVEVRGMAGGGLLSWGWILGDYMES